MSCRPTTCSATVDERVKTGSSDESSQNPAAAVTIAARRGYLAASADVRATPAAALRRPLASPTSLPAGAFAIRRRAVWIRRRLSDWPRRGRRDRQPRDRAWTLERGGDVRATLARQSAEPVVVNARIDPGRAVRCCIFGRQSRQRTVARDAQVSGDESPSRERKRSSNSSSCPLRSASAERHPPGCRPAPSPTSSSTHRTTACRVAHRRPLDQRIARVLIAGVNRWRFERPRPSNRRRPYRRRRRPDPVPARRGRLPDRDSRRTWYRDRSPSAGVSDREMTRSENYLGGSFTYCVKLPPR
jgi:hypothetical protein